MSHTEAKTSPAVVMWRRLETEIQTMSPSCVCSGQCIRGGRPVRHSATAQQPASHHRHTLQKVTFEFLYITTILSMTVCFIAQEELTFINHTFINAKEMVGLKG